MCWIFNRLHVDDIKHENKVLQSMKMNIPCLMWCIKWSTRNRNEERGYDEP